MNRELMNRSEHHRTRFPLLGKLLEHPTNFAEHGEQKFIAKIASIWAGSCEAHV